VINLPKKVRWDTAVYIENGPTLKTSGELNSPPSNAVNAVDVFSVTATAGIDTTVAVQPGELKKIEFIYIASDQYGDDTHNVSYKFAQTSAPEGISEAVTLEKPHLVTSRSLVALFTKAPNNIIITNGTDEPANIEIVIGRNA
jgi:hypothetical protein